MSRSCKIIKMVWSAEGEYIAVLLYTGHEADHQILVYHGITGSLIMEHSQDRSAWLVWSPAGAFLLIAAADSVDGLGHLLDVAARKNKIVLAGRKVPCWSPNGAFWATEGYDTTGDQCALVSFDTWTVHSSCFSSAEGPERLRPILPPV